jgi:hypothetical protein
MTFVEVNSPPRDDAPDIVLMSGVRVRVPGHVNSAALGLLLKVLESADDPGARPDFHLHGATGYAPVVRRASSRGEGASRARSTKRRVVRIREQTQQSTKARQLVVAAEGRACCGQARPQPACSNPFDSSFALARRNWRDAMIIHDTCLSTTWIQQYPHGDRHLVAVGLSHRKEGICYQAKPAGQVGDLAGGEAVCPLH